MLVVTLTSWVKRIGNVKPVVDSILKNTVLPDRIYINLSVKEFPHKEKDLPKDLVQLSKDNPKVIINWIKGENTKTMKKVFPILKYLGDNDLIINCDDDMLFPPDLIEQRLLDFHFYGDKHPVSGKRAITINFFHKMITMAPTSIFQKKMLNNWDKIVNDRIIKTYNDDRLYIYIFWLNGYTNRPCRLHEIDEMRREYNYNVIERAGEDYHLYPIGRRFDEIMIPEVINLTKKSLLGSFGFFRKQK